MRTHASLPAKGLIYPRDAFVKVFYVTLGPHGAINSDGSYLLSAVMALNITTLTGNFVSWCASCVFSTSFHNQIKIFRSCTPSSFPSLWSSWSGPAGSPSTLNPGHTSRDSFLTFDFGLLAIFFLTSSTAFRARRRYKHSRISRHPPCRRWWRCPQLSGRISPVLINPGGISPIIGPFYKTRSYENHLGQNQQNTRIVFSLQFFPSIYSINLPTWEIL